MAVMVSKEIIALALVQFSMNQPLKVEKPKRLEFNRFHFVLNAL